MADPRILSPKDKAGTLQEIERTIQTHTTRSSVYPELANHGELSVQRLTDHFTQRSFAPSDIAEFVRFCEECKSKFNGLEGAAMENLICELFLKIDRLFFFGVLSRKIKKYGDTAETNFTQIVLKPINMFEPNLYSTASDSKFTIELYVTDGKGCMARQFEPLLPMLVHEMCHVYIWHFTRARYNYLSRHCWDMLHFVFFELARGRIDEPGTKRDLDMIIEMAERAGFDMPLVMYNLVVPEMDMDSLQGHQTCHSVFARKKQLCATFPACGFCNC
ncbi:hypothetical protein F5Y18DRAFT_421609 [Xylariaceae sp. FL1019]|nr:hypothetical protein F5Y18DRAFT_421609 [Xylariaceae sp. FL1019]